MAHELASALQQAGGVRQCCAVKEPHVYVRSEYIHVAEGRISQTCNRTAVMQKLPDFVPAFSHHLKPLMRDGSQFTRMPFHPRIDGGIPLDSAVESQQFGSHSSFRVLLSTSILRFTFARETKSPANCARLVSNRDVEPETSFEEIRLLARLRDPATIPQINLPENLYATSLARCDSPGPGSFRRNLLLRTSLGSCVPHDPWASF